MIDPTGREREVIALLEEWPWDSDSTLIGGYALAAYGGARYSDDIDFTVPIASQNDLERWLRSVGFERVSPAHSSAALKFEEAQRYERGQITLDLDVGFVRDRDAKVDIPEKWISSRARRVRLDLLTGSVQSASRVARPEAIWALKLQSARDQDITDLFSISGEPVVSSQVRSLFHSLMVPTLAMKLDLAQEKARSEKVYADARSRLGLKDGDAIRARWTRFQGLLTSMIPNHD